MFKIECDEIGYVQDIVEVPAEEVFKGGPFFESLEAAEAAAEESDRITRFQHS